MTAPVATLRIDTSGTAFGTAPTWTDRTSYLMGESQYPVSITRGRQDEQGEPEPASCTFYLNNSTGFWTPGNAAAPANWDVGCPVNIQLTANAVTYDRFTGFVDSIEPTWPGGVQSWSVVKVTCTDITARLGRANGLKSLLHYEMLADSPSFFYPLTETAGSSSAGDASGNGNAPATRRNLANSAGVVEFGSDMTGSLIDTMAGVRFGSESTVGSRVSTLKLPTLPPAVGGFTLEMWVQMPSEQPSSTRIFYSASDQNHESWVLFFVNSDGTLRFRVRQASTAGLTVTAATADDFCDGGTHHVVGTFAADLQTVEIHVDGEQQNTAVAASPLSVSAINIAELGGSTVPTVSSCGLTVSHVAMFTGVLSDARILAHYQAGMGTATERSDLRFSRLATHAGITTSGLPVGLGTMGGQATDGTPAIEALRLVGKSEGTPVYATRAGALTFQARNARYNAAVSLTLASSDVVPSAQVRRDRQNLINEVSVNRHGGASQTAKDTTSQGRHGRFDAGSFDVALSTDDEALTGAQWVVATHKNPLTRLPDLTVNMLAQTNTTTIAQLLTADISTKFQVTSLPSQAPTSTFTGFVEGYTETIALNDWSMSFFTSPVTLEDSVFTLEDATKGQLNSTYVLAF